MWREMTACSVAVLAVLMLSGCSSSSGGGGKRGSSNQKINTWLATQAVDAPLPTYEVQPPDVITIVAPKIKEIDAQELTVRSDGKVDLNLLGEIHVAGKSPDQIAEDIRRLAARYYDPESLDVAVQVKEFRSKMIYVFGQVEEPGPKPYTGRDTIVHVLADARLNAIAWPKKIVIVRPHDDPGVRQKVTVDLEQMFSTGEISQNFMLEDGDVVYVPPTPLAQFNITFNRLLFPLRPAANVASVAAGGI